MFTGFRKLDPRCDWWHCAAPAINAEPAPRGRTLTGIHTARASPEVTGGWWGGAYRGGRVTLRIGRRERTVRPRSRLRSWCRAVATWPGFRSVCVLDASGPAGRCCQAECRSTRKSATPTGSTPPRSFTAATGSESGSRTPRAAKPSARSKRAIEREACPLTATDGAGHTTAQEVSLGHAAPRCRVRLKCLLRNGRHPRTSVLGPKLGRSNGSARIDAQHL